MAQYRCAICGSSKIVVEKKQEGYNKKKGIWGTILFGAAGAVAGAGGNTVLYYHCGDCGAVLNQPMSATDKDFIDNCLQSPDTFGLCLRDLKKKYKNIEWEEPPEEPVKKMPKKGLSEEEIAPMIKEYMKKAGKPVKLFDAYGDMGISEDDSYTYTCAVVDLFHYTGVIKPVNIDGDKEYFVYVKSVKERESLVLKYQAENLAEKLYRETEEDYSALLRDILKKPMKLEEIADYLKENNYLEEKVKSADVENPFVLESFIQCFLYKDGVTCGDGRVSYYICEDDKYRVKTENEMENEVDEMEQEYNDRVEWSVNNIFKPIVSVLQNNKEPMSTIDLLEELNEIGVMDKFDKELTSSSLAGIMRFLQEAGLVAKERKRIGSYYWSLNKTSKSEKTMDEKLVEVVKSSGYIISETAWRDS